VPPAFKSTEKMSKPPNPVIPFEEKIQNIVIRYEWKFSSPAVLIEFPKFSGMPKVPSAFTVTFHKSVPPREPGILDAK
jgi:hypothetical protein